jgi:glycogen debranching enzyme
VQAYCYAAYRARAQLARHSGDDRAASLWRKKAKQLKRDFNDRFWLPDKGWYAVGLDADKRPIDALASNMGHCLWTGIADKDKAAVVARLLMSPEMFSGWGIRTLASSMAAYNPMSYHNGSVWPHDNALVAAGLARYKKRQDAVRILEGLLQAAGHLKADSLPELFCGIPREERLGPVPYPVACQPQAWSAASIFMIVQAMLGMEVMGFGRKLLIDSAEIPKWLDWLKIEHLKVGDGEVSFIVRRIPEGASVGIIERRGNVAVEILK